MEEWGLSMEIARIFLRWKDEGNCSMTCWVSVDLPGWCRKERGGGISEANSLLTRISIRKQMIYWNCIYVIFQLGMSVLEGILPGVWELDGIGMLCITSLISKGGGHISQRLWPVVHGWRGQTGATLSFKDWSFKSWSHHFFTWKIAAEMDVNALFSQIQGWDWMKVCEVQLMDFEKHNRQA